MLTIAILIYAYRFVADTIAEPINVGVREVVLRASYYPAVSDEEVDTFIKDATDAQRSQWRKDADGDVEAERELVHLATRRHVFEKRWKRYAFPLDLIGLIIAAIIIYMFGGLLSNYLGRRLYRLGEGMIKRIPFIKQVYPSVKQVTDFFFGDQQSEQKIKFNRAVAVEYPRKGLWSIGLVTGDTLRNIQEGAGTSCVTIFVPSSPTPFTGYVITVPKTDTIDLPITIEEALRFTISGGVIVPDGQRLDLPAPQDDTKSADIESGEPPANSSDNLENAEQGGADTPSEPRKTDHPPYDSDQHPPR